MRYLVRGTGAVGLLVLLALGFAGSATADISFCSSGSGAGQCSSPQGVAVEHSTGRTYVMDSGNNRVNVFEADGTFAMAFGWGVADGVTPALQACGPEAVPPTAACFQGLAGSGAGQFTGGRGIAVDNNPASPAFQDVYVVDGNILAARVQRFSPAGEFVLMFGGDVNKTKVAAGGTAAERSVCVGGSGDVCGAGVGGVENERLNRNTDPIAVGPGGTVYVGDSRREGSSGGSEAFVDQIKKFQPSGAFVETIPLADQIRRLVALAVDSNDDFYVAVDFGGTGISKYDSDGDLLYAVDADVNPNTTALAIDGVDTLYAAQLESGFRIITRYAPSGAHLSRFGYGDLGAGCRGLAVYASPDGDVFCTDGNLVKYLLLPDPGPVIAPPSVEAAPVGNTKATLNARINPEGKATTYHFEYVDHEAFEEDGFSGPDVLSTPQSGSIGSDFTLHSVQAEIGCPVPQSPPQASCLVPETVYHFRVVATNADGAGNSPVEGDPFETKPPIEVSELWSTDVGTDTAQLHASVNPLGIPATGRFEYVADATYQADVKKAEEAGAEDPESHGFDHAAEIPNEALGQASIDFGSGNVGAIGGVQLSSLTPDTLYRYRIVAANAFATVSSSEHTFTTFPPPPAPKADCPNQAFRTGASANLPNCRAYEMVSPVDKNGGDIAVVRSALDFPAGLDQSSIDGDRISYSAATAFAGALSAPWTSQYVANRDEAAGAWLTEPISPPRASDSLTGNQVAKFDVQYKAFSESVSDGWVLHDTEPTLDGCAEPGHLNLYRRDNADGSYEALTTAKPTNLPADQYWPELQGVSDDGSHAVFAAKGKLTGNASSNNEIFQLYEHVSGKGCGQLRLVSVLPNGNASTQHASAGTAGGFRGESRENTLAEAVSDDGTRIFWTASSGEAGPGALYVRINGTGTVEISGGTARFWTAASDGSRVLYTEGGTLREFNVDSQDSVEIAKGVAGVAGASEDATRIYFVSSEELGGEGKAGVPNLYLRQPGGAVKLVATLAPADVTENFRQSGLSVASPFPVKRGTRTTPDGRWLAFVSTAPLTGFDSKDAATGRPSIEVFLYDASTGELVCPSCNPTGARPAAREFKGANSDVRTVAALMPAWENHLYAPRALSPDGSRVFFESFEALVPRDRNSKADVYQWERASGEAECLQTKGGELHVESSGGCLSLISSGEGPADSHFADATPDGSDVFIKTDSSLLPQDPGLIDIYDARELGGLPAPPAPDPACEGEACQSPPAPPDDPTPSSSAFAGGGNLKPKDGRRRCPKAKRRVRRNGKSRCVPRKKKQSKRQPRRRDG